MNSRRTLPDAAFFIKIPPKPPESPEFQIFSAPDIPAFFIAAQKPVKVVPMKTPSGRVEFRVEGHGIDEAVADFYADSQIGVATYNRALKGLRSAIFALKGPLPAGGR